MSILKCYNGDITVFYHVTFFGGHSVKKMSCPCGSSPKHNLCILIFNSKVCFRRTGAFHMYICMKDDIRKSGW